MGKGIPQQEGIDLLDIFSPLTKVTTIRIVLAFAASHNKHLHQLYINNTFFHRDLNEEVYIELPQGFSSPQPNLVCKLQKSF